MPETDYYKDYRPIWNISRDAHSLLLDAKTFMTKWRELALDRLLWVALSKDERETFREGLIAFKERFQSARSKMQKVVTRLKRVHEQMDRLEQAKNPLKLPRYWFPSSFDTISGQQRGLISFMIQLCAHEGGDPDALYPQHLVDRYAAAKHVGKFQLPKENQRSALDFPQYETNQMLGYGISVQSAPLEYSNKVMLLQILGGDYPWLSSPDCVYQFWISKFDLRFRRFNRAFLTLECT